MAGHVVVYVTAPAGARAAAIARQLVEARLAACVNLVRKVRSIYRWEGKVCDDEEDLLVIKTTRAVLPRLRDRVLAIHPYSCPEVIALPIVGGHPAYLLWIGNEVALAFSAKRRRSTGAQRKA